MATDSTLRNDFTNDHSYGFSLWGGIKRVLEPAASLKLTVALFALSIFLILAGTFAQVDKDIWEVIGLYFRCWFAWVPLQVFFPESFFPEKPLVVPGGFWFPGGKLLGLLLATNLLAAHLVRFKAVATGLRLFMGMLGIGMGCLVTWVIVVSGGNSKGIQAEPLLPYSTQWIFYQALLAAAFIVAGYSFLVLWQRPLSKSGTQWARQLFLRSIVAIGGIGSAALLAWIVQEGEAVRPSDASLRILWQLTQGSAASFALLGGCWTVFGKRAGMVLLHGGVGLMMFYELHVALTAIETQMNLAEGERTNFVQDIRTSELAFTDVTDPKEEHVVAIPKSLVRNSIGNKPIDHPDLPFTVEGQSYLQNARLKAVSSKKQNPATAGVGLLGQAVAITPGAGVDTDSKIDMPAVYVTLKSKQDGSVLGTYLASQWGFMTDQTDTVKIGEKTYRIEFRPKRYYKPYQFELKDISKKDYLGTNTPRSYSSVVHIIDPTRNVDEKKTIWMNNPLRFADETFYQSGYSEELGVKHTTLSVVANSGWMMPYVGCMFVTIGMLFHFLYAVIRFLTRGDSNLTEDESDRFRGVEMALNPTTRLATVLGIKKKPVQYQPDLPSVTSTSNLAANIVAGLVVACALFYIGSQSRAPHSSPLALDLYRFGQIPVVSEGRTKPLDSVANTALLAITGRKFVKEGEGADAVHIPAIQWLLEVISESKIADERPVFRIEHLGVQETMGVMKNKEMRYSWNEIKGADAEFEKQVGLARQQSMSDRKQLSVYQKKILELSDKITTFQNLKHAFNLHLRFEGKTFEEVRDSYAHLMRLSEILDEKMQPVFAVGPVDKDDSWHTFARAWLLDLPNRSQKNGKENKVVVEWENIFRAYGEKKPAAFNKSVDDLLKLIDDHPPADVRPSVVRLESYFNHVEPFTIACRLYLVAFIIGMLGWLTWPLGFNRTAFSLLVVTLALHSVAILARLIISGRPPVTNLYSSAVFIGWGCVIVGLAFEFIYRIGIGNIVAGVAGYATLLIADVLSSDGDTFTVLQAVLDTQFWLATHVTCITMGYATTYLAGLFGAVYIIRGVCTPSLTAENGRDIYRMIYGTLCFSIFFSFVGTVLGGLWADDSWGRFWGWDPKENAALIIVLWNALALHARWGGMVRERGLAALAVGGNIFVSWSWWGVNALGAGLHSYGFKQGTLLNLLLFIAVNMLIIGIGMLPRECWWSLRRRSAMKMSA